MKPLPEYQPPNIQRARVAASLSPLVVMLVFTALMASLIDGDTAMVWFAGCSFWLGYEVWDYQSQEDAYNAEYEARYLGREPLDVLKSWAACEELAPPTRAFVQRVAQRRQQAQRQRPLS